MLHLALLFLLPSLAMGGLVEEQKAAWCAIKCLPEIAWPPTAGANCLRLVYNATTKQGNDKWEYDRLVFEGPECGTYNFVIRTKSNLTMLTTPFPIEHHELNSESVASAARIACLRGCGYGLLEETCAAPTFSVTMGFVNYASKQTVYRAWQFGCEKKTTIIRSYRPELEILAELEPVVNHSPSYNEIWSIKRGFLETTPHHNNIMFYSIAVTPPEEEKNTDKNVCALRCFNLKDPTSPAFPTGCSKTLANETVTDKNGKWGYIREVYEGPECGVYTFSITTRSNVSSSIDHPNAISSSHNNFESAEIAKCVRSCGFDVCARPLLTQSNGVVDPAPTASVPAPAQVYNYAHFECDGIKTVIVRSFRNETVVRIDLERDETPKLYSEKWRVNQGQLVTETAPHGQ